MKLKKFLKAVQAKCASQFDCVEGKCPFAEKRGRYTVCMIMHNEIPESWDVKKILKAAKLLEQQNNKLGG